MMRFGLIVFGGFIVLTFHITGCGEAGQNEGSSGLFQQFLIKYKQADTLTSPYLQKVHAPQAITNIEWTDAEDQDLLLVKTSAEEEITAASFE